MGVLYYGRSRDEPPIDKKQGTMMNYMNMCVGGVTKVTIQRHEFGVSLKLHGEDGFQMQSISLHGVEDFVEVEDLTVPPQVKPMIVP